MTEYFSSHESSDDDDKSEVAPSKDVSVKPLGELLFRGGNQEKNPEKPAVPEKVAEHQTIWQRVVERPPEAVLNAKAETEDDDDDDDEEKPSESRQQEKRHEENVPLEHLSHEEERAVIGEYVANRSVELQAGQPDIEPNSPEDAAAAANAMLLDKIDEKLGREDAAAEAVVDDAYTEAAEEIRELDPQALEDEPAQEPESVPPAEETEDDSTAMPTPAGSSSGSGASTPPPVGPPPASGGGGGYTPPPGGYGRPFMPVPQPGGGANPNMPNVASSPNAAPDPNTVTRDQLLYEVRLGQDRGIVAGGLLGYIIGRRRGRIRTEKRLMPVQKKLEKQVETLHKTVAGKEQEIRKLAADKIETVQNVEQRELVIEHIRPQPVPPETLAAIPTAEIAPVSFPLQAAERQEQRQLPALERAHEQVTIPAGPEAAPVSEKHVENVKRMSREELLRTSEKVVIDGTSLRTVYEAKQITEPGLRHILAEFLSGGDVKRALDQELVVKQLTYERDPHVRDQMSAGYPARTAAGGAPARTSSQDILPLDYKPKPDASSQQPVRAQASPEKDDNEPENTSLPGQQLIVTGWLVLVVILAFVAAILLVTRG